MATADGLELRDAVPGDLVAGTRLLADSLGFGPEDQIPPWLAQDAQEKGAVALVAVAGAELVGFSLALPALGADGPELFSCGLAVAPHSRSSGIGRRLKLLQRERARERGIAVIRWRADPLNAAALRLYLDGLGARVVGYSEAPYRLVRDDGPVPHDDVEVEWQLDGAPRRPVDATQLVELPWDRGELGRAHGRWRMNVRRRLTDALSSGSVGIAIDRDRAARRAWMRFAART